MSAASADGSAPKFTRIIADPPWLYGSKKALVGTGGRGATPNAGDIVQIDAAAQYACMTLEELTDLPVEMVSAQDSMLFMWATNAFLADGSAADVVRAWGFTPKTVVTWAKVQADGITPSRKVGHWFRGASEHVIVATRGRPKRPQGFPALATWFPHCRLPHSVKPETLHEIVEQTGEGPYLEMFARRMGRSGWTYWGNEL